MTKKEAAVLTLLSLALVFLGLLLSRRFWFRLDLTRGKAHTLSDVSRNLYREIAEPLRITYYVSKRLSAAHPLPGEVEDLLLEYVSWSRGKIRLMVRDPAGAAMEEEIESLGMESRQIEIVERDQTAIATVYSGIVIEYLDRLELLPAVFSLDALEYDVSSRIRSLVRETERQIGVLVGDAYRDWDSQYRLLNQALVQAAYQVRLLSPGEEIPDTLPVLLVLGGAEDLDDWALYRIDRYIRLGGRVLFALEGVSVDLENNFQARLMPDRGLLAMVSFYGATVKQELSLDRTALTLEYQTRSPGGVLRIRRLRYPHWIGISRENANSAHPLGSRFGGLDLFWPGHIELYPPDGVEAETLFTTSAEGWVQKDNFATNPEFPDLMENTGSEPRGKKPLAVVLTGIFPGWFQGIPKPRREGSSEELPDMPAEAVPSRILVVADTDMAGDLIWYSQSERNLDFILQAADWLGNDDDLLGIRNRNTRTGRLDRIGDPLKRAGMMDLARFINIFVVPLGIAAGGILLRWKRRRAGALPRGGRSDGV
ncbi:MAG: GldG family protein [Treponema sp.]|jgi:ABC-type uncharacterized transport system involved in gliding motility auxiliary subunit|nr:GldG family protein [Treponema sp.]